MFVRHNIDIINYVVTIRSQPLGIHLVLSHFETRVIKQRCPTYRPLAPPLDPYHGQRGGGRGYIYPSAHMYVTSLSSISYSSKFNMGTLTTTKRSTLYPKCVCEAPTIQRVRGRACPSRSGAIQIVMNCLITQIVVLLLLRISYRGRDYIL